MREGAAVREGHQLGEGVGAFRAAEERGVSALRADECCGFGGGGSAGEAGAAEGEVYRHFCFFNFLIWFVDWELAFELRFVCPSLDVIPRS